MADFTFDANTVCVAPRAAGDKIFISVKGVDESEILGDIGPNDIIACCGIGELLDEMDVDEVKKHFDFYDDTDIDDRVQEALRDRERERGE